MTANGYRPGDVAVFKNRHPEPQPKKITTDEDNN
jgi:hypothetical protein